MKLFKLPALAALLAAPILAQPLAAPALAQQAQDVATALRSPNAPPGAIWLETLELKNIIQSYGEPGVAESLDDHPLTIKGQVFPHGVGTHAHAVLALDLKGSATRFATWLGVDDETRGRGSVSMRVLVDGQLKFQSPTVRGGEPPTLVDVDLRGAQALRLEVLEVDNLDQDHADLAGAALFLTPEALKQGEAVLPILIPAPPRAASELPPLLPTPLAPQINGARLVGASPGKPFLHLIATTGRGPFTFSARGLPAGLSLDARTGIISGSIAAAGTYTATLEARNDADIDSKPLRIECGAGKLALTPILAWNAWSVFGEFVTARDVARQVDWLVQSGLAARGWQYVIVDDTWQSRRDPDGTIGANRRFGSMRSLCDYVHSKGLKIGLLSGATPSTCNGFAGSAGFEEQDAALYARWGVDLVKYDWCPEDAKKNAAKREDMVQSYKKMRAALDKTPRDIVLSMVTYGFGGPAPQLGHEAGAQMWRVSEGIIDTWDSMSRVAFGQADALAQGGPGGWNDLGQLMVGRFTPRNAHFSNLSPDEQKLQVTAWAMGASPLIISCDLSQLDPSFFYRLATPLLTNTEVLAIDQDPLGKPASVLRADDSQVWTRPLADGRLAVALFNRRGWGQETIKVSWDDLKLAGAQRVRDVWTGRDLGSVPTELSADVKAHGAALFLVGEAK